MHLLHQRGPLHDLPDDPAAYDAVLAGVTETALARMTPEGSLENPAAGDDIGDTSLGITSLLALAWHRTKDPRLPEAVRRSLAFHLRSRVYTEDNPGYPNLTARDTGLPYARYVLEAGAHPIGDWPSTVWALLQAVNVLDAADGLVEEEQYRELLRVAGGYWRWLTEATVFNPQDAANQAIGCVVGGLMLARHLPSEEGGPVRQRALRLYADEIRARRVRDRGAPLPPEHGGAYDNNYGPISLSFLAQAHRVSGEEVFAEDGETLARYIDARVCGSGFDIGGPRYSEQHSAFESVLGLRYFGHRIGADIGRYAGDARWARHAVGADGGVDGHFAFMLVWQIQDTTGWHRTQSAAPARHQLRSGTVTVSFDDRMTPAVIEAGGTVLIAAAVNRQHGFGPVTDGFLLCRPMGAVRVADQRAGGLAAKLVTKPVVGRDHVLRQVRSLYVTDGTRLWTTVVVERLDGERYLLAGMPYVTADGDRLRRVGDFPLVAAAGGLRLTHPPQDEPDSFDARSELTQQQAAFALAADPRGYGDPDAGWRHVRTTSALEAGPAPDAPEGLDVFAVRYGPADSGRLDLVCERTEEGLVVRTESFTAVLGEADEHGEPRLTLTTART
ncbi:hypothetical protein KUF83_19370 [Streptomyces sp. BV286]|uniref:hypothetical protein n=1 Tax=Streptomyces sp. BV286 TaxID=2849672 RepID=UPI001C2E37D0|nr:hypothetical protein [Streptomyces sp. BV286]MBV1938707.1 hypothetical protein [Streptomyces sp. BV286]